MAITWIGAVGSRAEQNITTLARTMQVKQNCPVGSEIFVAYVAENDRPGFDSGEGTVKISEGSALTALTDSKSNTYTAVYEMYGPFDGALSVGLWHSKITTALVLNTDNIAITFAAAATPSPYSYAAGAAGVKVGAGKKLQANGSIGPSNGGTSAAPSLGFSGATNVEHFLLGMTGLLAPGSDGFGQDSQYVSINAPSSNDYTLRWGRRIAKVTSDTWSVTLENVCDHLELLTGWDEVNV